MQTKTKIILIALLSLTAFAFGRYSAPSKVKTEVKTVYVEKKTERTEEKKHVETVTTEKPDGTKETRTVEDDSKKTTESDSTSNTTTRDKEVTRADSKVTLSAMAGVRPFSGDLPVYGGSLSKPILGPITVGIWGLNTGTVGASVGLTF